VFAYRAAARHVYSSSPKLKAAFASAVAVMLASKVALAELLLALQGNLNLFNIREICSLDHSSSANSTIEL
jgi:hypothetical protein